MFQRLGKEPLRLPRKPLAAEVGTAQRSRRGIMLRKSRLGQHTLHSRVKRLVVIVGDKTVPAVAEKLAHTGNIGRDYRLSEDQPLGDKVVQIQQVLAAGAQELVDGPALAAPLIHADGHGSLRKPSSFAESSR